MQIAQILAGYTLGEADLLRRAMGKKIKAEMDAQRERFVEGAKAKGVDQDKASFIFDLVAKFAGYGFNKSHAAAYAMVAYQTAYCKANYPVEFMAATMSFDQNNTDKLASIKNDLRQMGIELRQPDINRSGVNFSVVKPDVEGAGSLAIRYALAAIKNVGEKAMRSIIEERDSNGEFKNIFDLAERIDSRLVNKRQMENLIAAGAFDGLEPNRALLMRNVELFVRHAHAAAKARSSAQTNLFGAKGSVIDRPPLAEAALWSDAEKLKRERDAIGFFLSAHPLEIYADMLAQAGVKGSATVLSEKEFIGKTVRLAGAVDYLKERRAAKSGNRYAFFGLSDMEGSYEAVVFSNVLDAVRDAVDDGGPVVVTVEVQKRDSGDGSLSLLLRGIEALEKVAERTSKSLHIFLDHEDAVPVLSKLLGDNAGGKGMVQCLVRSGHKEIRVDLPGRYKISPELKSAIATLHGVEDVQIV